MEEAVQSASPPAQAGPCVHYERRQPEETVLYQRVQAHAETLFAQVEAETEVSLPKFEAFRQRWGFSPGLAARSVRRLRR